MSEKASGNGAAAAAGVRSDGRTAILDRLRTQRIEAPELPELSAEQLIQYDDLVAQFTQAATGVGAAVHRVESGEQIQQTLHGLPLFTEARRVASLAPEHIAGNTDLRMYDDPHYLKGLDWLIAKGQFGVAENGAIWMEMSQVTHRACFFITQFLVIILPADQLVPQMHAAYDRLGPAVSQPFGLFLSGPSKTADIEQSLVLGAHGCRTLTIFLV